MVRGVPADRLKRTLRRSPRVRSLPGTEPQTDAPAVRPMPTKVESWFRSWSC